MSLIKKQVGIKQKWREYWNLYVKRHQIHLRKITVLKWTQNNFTSKLLFCWRFLLVVRSDWVKSIGIRRVTNTILSALLIIPLFMTFFLQVNLNKLNKISLIFNSLFGQFYHSHFFAWFTSFSNHICLKRLKNIVI